MSVFKCKMCGGTLDVTEGVTVCECEYCGTQQTITTSKDENMQALFNRANILRMKSEFDKAEQLYEKLVQNNPDDPEAHWGLILCKFGIEYVEDPATFKRIPTCHRTSFDSIIADEDYKEALRCADTVQRGIYEREAKEIDRIQKEILALSAKEEPYDVFICYKETDEGGSRTPDSAIANDIYYQLTNEGFKVFYAAITLEDKLGSAYEPCIFAALNSAKVMLAIGTKPEYFNAVWVKNEWSRFLKMMKKDRTKLLIPCYKNMDAYELPEEFAHLQAQDMGKIGFINDIVRGIKKVIVKDEPKPAQTVVTQVSSGNANVDSLLKRVFIFLEDGDWQSADEYCEKVLDLAPENGEAYLGKLMTELKVSKRDNLKNYAQPFDSSSNYQKIMRYGDDALKTEMKNCTQYIKDRNHRAYQESVYQKALSVYQNMSSTKEEVTEARDQFNSISGYKDADEYVRGYGDRINEIDYQEALAVYQNMSSTKDQVTAAKDQFKSISGYKDADDYVQGYDDRIREIDYQKALSIYNNPNSTKAQITTAKSLFESVSGYKDSSDYIIKCIEKIHGIDYREAVKLCSSRKAAQADFKKAIALFEATDGYKDSAEQIVRCRESIEYLDNLEIYNSASKLLSSAQSDYKKGIENSNPDHISSAIKKLSEAIQKFVQIKSFKDSLQCLADSEKLMAEYEQARIKITADNQAAELAAQKAKRRKKIIAAVAAVIVALGVGIAVLTFTVIIPELKYNNAVELMNSGKYDDAITAFTALNGYKDSSDKLAEIISVFASVSAKNHAFISTGYSHTVGLKKDGTVVAVGSNNYGQCDVSGWKDIIAVSAGYNHTVGLKKDGTVVAVGDNFFGQCNVSDWKDIIAVSAGEYHTVGLKKDGTVVAVGDNGKGRCDVSGWKDIIAVSAGEYHTVGLKKDGTVVVVGYKYGQCDVSGWSDIIAVSAGGSHTVGLKKDGTVVAVGDNYYGQCNVSGWSDIIAVSAGDDHTVGLKRDGTVAAVGDNDDGQCDVSGWSDIIAVSAGYYHTVGLKRDGTVVAVGRNGYGQCDVSGWELKTVEK